MTKREKYYIEYGIAHLGGTGKRGIDFHKTYPMGKIKTEKILKKLNKKWEYTTVFKRKDNKWDVIW